MTFQLTSQVPESTRRAVCLIPRELILSCPERKANVGFRELIANSLNRISVLVCNIPAIRVFTRYVLPAKLEETRGDWIFCQWVVDKYKIRS